MLRPLKLYEPCYKAVRGGGMDEHSARDRLMRKKGNSLTSSVSYSTDSLVKSSEFHKDVENVKHDYELANVWANMLQALDFFVNL